MVLAKNRKAYYEYEILDKYLAGIVLKGYEVKAIRERSVNLEGSYITIRNGEAYIENMHIGKYSKMSQKHSVENSRKSRKLLLTEKEIHDLKRELNEKGQTAVPLALLLRKNMIKLEFALARGRKKHGKKEYLKRKQMKEDLRERTKEVRRSI